MVQRSFPGQVWGSRGELRLLNSQWLAPAPATTVNGLKNRSVVHDWTAGWEEAKTVVMRSLRVEKARQWSINNGWNLDFESGSES
ncbi:hypothetical protein ACFX12_025644 [Malus domestica]